jgi:hypothetical protein
MTLCLRGHDCYTAMTFITSNWSHYSMLIALDSATSAASTSATSALLLFKLLYFGQGATQQPDARALGASLELAFFVFVAFR